MAEANLLVTFDPTREESAKKEIEELLNGLKEKFKVIKIDEGLAQLNVGDAKKVVKSLGKLKDNKFVNTHKWIPIDKWCNAKIPDMLKVVKEIEKGIAQKDKWKMDVGKHKSDLHERELIMKLTEVVDKPNVDLEKPDKIIKVEIVGNKAGISLLNKDELIAR